MRAARCRQAMESAPPGAWIYPRYPRYPQANWSWIGPGFVTARSTWPRRSSGNGGEPSQPRPEPSGLASHQARSGEAKGRAADEAAARRKLRACPLADAKAACFVKRPSISRRPSGRREVERAGPRDLRVQGLSGGKRDLGRRAATGGPSGFGPRIFRAVKGFGPALRNRRTQGFGSGTARQNRGFGRGSCRERNRGFGRGTAGAGSGTQVPNLPSGEPPGLRPCRGARGET